MQKKIKRRVFLTAGLSALGVATSGCGAAVYSADIATSVGRVDLQLSGHTHGGQVRIPFYGALRLPPLGQRYPSGLYRSGSMLHYTNRGVGMVSPLVRFNCRPEITVFACHPA
jgi:predicted MPP superfamily phosphohydrolase